MCWCWHKWEKWIEAEDTRTFITDKRDSFVTETALFVTQERKCSKCGLIQIRGIVA